MRGKDVFLIGVPDRQHVSAYLRDSFLAGAELRDLLRAATSIA